MGSSLAGAPEAMMPPNNEMERTKSAHCPGTAAFAAHLER